ncbi:Nucleoid occlusion protein [subsurface metagenome]
MAKITEMLEIPLGDLELSKGQSRTREPGKGIPELADSIRKVGQLEPIVVCHASKPGKYEILTGQRRFLACKDIGQPTILAAVMDERVDETTAKIISVTENLVRRDLNRRDLIDACTFLYKKYGSIQAVHEETGLPYPRVQDYVKYDRLISELKDLVDKGEVELKTALRAQEAAAKEDRKINATKAVHLAREISPMSGVQQQKVADEIRNAPDKPMLEVIERAKTGEKLIQIMVTITATVHQSLQTYARAEGTTQDDAAGTLIEEGLETRGYLEEE